MQIAANSRRTKRKQQNHPRIVPEAKPVDSARQLSDSDHESAAQQVQLALAKTLEQVSSSLDLNMIARKHV